MLGPGRYLLGVAELALLVGFAWLGASRAAQRACCRGSRAPRRTSRPRVLALALLIWVGRAARHASAPSSRCRTSCSSCCRVWALGALRRVARGRGSRGADAASAERRGRLRRDRTRRPRASRPDPRSPWPIAAIAVLHFAAGVKTRLATGMTGFDSHLVPRAVRGRLLPERQHAGPALHRAAVPGLVLPGERRNLPRGRDAGVRAGPALAAAEPRLVRGLPARLLVHRAAVPGRALVAGARARSR